RHAGQDRSALGSAGPPRPGATRGGERAADEDASAASGATAPRPHRGPRPQALRLALPSGRLVVRGDPMRLEQVLTNLLDNASKYSDSGAIIDFSVALGRGRGGNEACILLRDRGIGMTPDTLPTIFDLFSQADVPIARSRGGLGIGLTLVR